MNEEGDTPTAPEVVQSTPMVSLNDEIAPKTDNKKSVFQRVGSLIGGKRKASVETESEEEIVAQLVKELEDCRRERDRYKIAHQTSEAEKKELITEMNCVIKLKSAKIENLQANINYEAKLKTKEIESLKIAHLKTEAEMESLITKMDCEAKLKSSDIEKFKRGLDSLNEKLQESRDEIDGYKNELDSNASQITEMNNELRSKSSEIDNLKIAHLKSEAGKQSLITKMEFEAKLNSAEIEKFKKMEAELKSAMTRMESDLKTKSEEIDNLKRKSEHEMASSKLESDKLNEKLEANKEEFDRYKRDFDAKKTEMDNKMKLKAKEIENLKKLEVEWKSRISQLEKDVKVAKNGENLKISGDVQRILEKVEKSSNDLRSLHIQTSGDVRTGFEKVEKNLRSILERTTEVTIRARFTEISKLADLAVDSGTTAFAGFEWRIRLHKEDAHIGIYLKSENFSNAKWPCTVHFEYQLISQKDYSIVKCLELPAAYVFHDGVSAWGFPKFIPFEDLLNGDAVKDDSIIVAVVVKVFPSN